MSVLVPNQSQCTSKLNTLREPPHPLPHLHQPVVLTRLQKTTHTIHICHRLSQSPPLLAKVHLQTVGTAHQPDQALSALTLPQEDLTSQAPAHIDPHLNIHATSTHSTTSAQCSSGWPRRISTPPIHPVLMFLLCPSSQVNALECIHIKGCR